MLIRFSEITGGNRMRFLLGMMVVASMAMAQEPNVELVEQNILNNSITVKRVYEAPPVTQKKSEINLSDQKLKGLLSELVAASIHVVRVGESIQFVIPTEAIFNGSSNDIAPMKRKTLRALKELVTVGDKHPVNFYALGKTKVDSRLVYGQALKLLEELGQIKELNTGLALLTAGRLNDHKDLPFWQIVKPGTNVICIEYQLKGGQKFFNG